MLWRLSVLDTRGGLWFDSLYDISNWHSHLYTPPLSHTHTNKHAHPQVLDVSKFHAHVVCTRLLHHVEMNNAVIR